MRQRIERKYIIKKIKILIEFCKNALDLYNLMKLNYVIEIKLGEDYLYEKGDNLAQTLENYFVEEGYDIIVECYTEDKNSYLIIDCEDEIDNMWDVVSFIYRLLVKLNIKHEIIW
ncbi:hypothetical protein UT300007_17900 [Clostridium sp. CTA-7]